MTPQAVHLGIYDTMSDWEVGYVTAHINKRDWQRRPGRYRVVTVGATTEPVTTMGGLRVAPDITLDELSPDASAMLILAGSETWGPTNSGANTAFADAARRFLDAGVPVAAICGATLGLAAAGLLDDREHTSNAAQFVAFAPRYAGAAHYRDEPVVVDRGLITATGTAPVAFARSIFDALDLYAPDVADAWFDLYGTGDPAAFFRLEQAAR
ncbi:DJ-1/PfpI family protein [Rhodococcus daqingensis]|uniref:DJ-1/PfpI family protein n=1 Tax=Rhodococcus daqingensis TaxID=2479363 RepID=A0ABW2RUE5_9NOCA